MQKLNHEYIWKFLQENNCEHADNITNGMLCIICAKLMVNPYSGKCGCRYCLGCVKDYLNGNKKCCPGITGDNCNDQLMIIGETVVPDHAINLDISRLNVKCPRDSCDFMDELRKMEEHERVCRKQAVVCPYCPIGCQGRYLFSNKINEHLAEENESHAKLLMDCIGRLQNEIQSMKRDNFCLKEEVRKQQMVVEQQVVKIEQMDQEMHVLEDENRSMKDVIVSLQSAVETITESLATKSALEQQVSEMRGLLETQTRDIEQLQKNDLVRQKEQDERLGHIEEAHKRQVRGDDVVMPVQRKLINVENRTKGEFVWCVDDWAARRLAARNELDAMKRVVKNDDEIFEQVQKDESTKVRIFSDTFYLHEQGYRMCLSVWPDGYDDDLIISWRLVRGPFDKHLSWPFRGTVTLSVIDQETRQDFTSFTVSSDQYLNDERLNKPTTEKNFGLISEERVEKISCNPAVCRNDQVLIRCVVNMSPPT